MWGTHNLALSKNRRDIVSFFRECKCVLNQLPFYPTLLLSPQTKVCCHNYYCERSKKTKLNAKHFFNAWRIRFFCYCFPFPIFFLSHENTCTGLGNGGKWINNRSICVLCKNWHTHMIEPLLYVSIFYTCLFFLFVRVSFLYGSPFCTCLFFIRSPIVFAPQKPSIKPIFLFLHKYWIKIL